MGSYVRSVDISSAKSYFVATTVFEIPPKTCLFDLNNPNPKRIEHAQPEVTSQVSDGEGSNRFKLIWEKEGVFEYLLKVDDKIAGINWNGVVIFDENTGNTINEMQFTCPYPTADAYGEYIFVGCDKVLRAIRVNGKGEIIWKQELSDTINAVATDGEKVVAGCRDGKTYVVDRNGTKVFTRFFGNDSIADVKIAENVGYAAITTMSGKIYLIDINSGDTTWQYELEYPVYDLSTLPNGNVLDISPNGDTIVVGSTDNNVYFFESGNPIWKAYVGGDVCNLLYLPNSGVTFVGTCDDKGSITTINSNGLVLEQKIVDGVLSMATDESGRIIAVGSDDVYFFKDDGIFLQSYETGSQITAVFSMVFTDACDLIVSMQGYKDDKTILLDVPDVNELVSAQNPSTPLGYSASLKSSPNILSSSYPVRVEYFLLLGLIGAGLGYYIKSKRSKLLIETKVSKVSKSQSIQDLQKEYEILEYLGGGGFADVYKAKANDKVVAIKVPRELRPEFEETFLNEVEKWRKLDHRNIVKLIKPRLNPPHLVLEYVDGGTLKDKLKKGKLSVTEACKIAYDVARALEYAHSKLIIHTDINPKNILLTSFGEAKLTDFGLAKIVTSSSGIRGLTLEYSAPEQLKGKADEKTDVYQLGLLLYEMLTGFNPFSSGDIQEVERRIMESTPDPPSKFVDGVEELDDLIMRCLSKNPDERPSIREFRERIYEFMKKSYGVSLHLTRDFRSYAKMCVELAFYSAKESDLARCLAELKAAREKVGDREIREELDKAIEMVEYMIRENVHSEEFLRMLEVLVRRI